MCRPAESISTQKPQPTEQKADIPSKNVFAMFDIHVQSCYFDYRINPFNPKLIMQILPTIQEEND